MKREILFRGKRVDTLLEDEQDVLPYIYLDNAATTVISQDVKDAVNSAMQEGYGNPGTLYLCGRNAKNAVERARQCVAESMNARPENIIFTSGGSEANSTVFFGIADYMKSHKKDTIIVSAIEHDSVLKAAESVCMKLGFHLIKLGVSKEGTVSVDDLENLLKRNGSRVGLVSIMYVNNEIGSVNHNIDMFGQVCKKYVALFHSDCVQAFGFKDIDVKKIGCDFLSVSSHKIHGPKGIGALYVSDSVLAENILEPIIYGGAGQEFGLRGGTENVPGIVGFGQACLDLKESSCQDISKVACRFLTEFLQGMKQAGLLSIVSLNGCNAEACTKILSITIHGIDNETLALAMDKNGICIGTGSACRSHEVTPSHVLKAIGLSDDDSMSTIRVSFSRYSTTDEAIDAARTLVSICEMLTGCMGDA